MTLDDQLRIYPGHNYGDKTNDTLKEQKKTNPYLTCNDKLTFLRKRMGLKSYLKDEVDIM